MPSMEVETDSLVGRQKGFVALGQPSLLSHKRRNSSVLTTIVRSTSQEVDFPREHHSPLCILLCL